MAINIRQHSIAIALKEFGPAGMKVTEEVALHPSLHKYGVGKEWDSNIFSLRIDADEYDPETFSLYYPVFEKYRDLFTIFINANSFVKAEEAVVKCRDIRLDVQSHGFYHHTYNDYASNRYNLAKAKEFFEKMEIATIGFAAPHGRWNMPLTRALEDEGYKYSSDFSYDYMGYPSYPSLRGNVSGILEIPVFPVAPELFFQDKNNKLVDIERYYFNAIDEMVKLNIPVIMYAHTSVEYREVPRLLERITEYALGVKGLKGKNMTDIHDSWTNLSDSEKNFSNKDKSEVQQNLDFFGKPATNRYRWWKS